MEYVPEFNLNKALRCWLEALAQSPQFRKENLRELESHVRDSVDQLQTHGLSAEESFLIATRRVGSMERLESEFAKVNPSPWNKIVHGLILGYFTFGCWWLYAILLLIYKSAPHFMVGRSLPFFSVLCLALMNYWYVPALAAAVYCGFVWFRKSGGRRSWIGFLAITTAVLMFLFMNVFVAFILPIIDTLNQHAGGQ
jgi:hypothetical protein